MLFVASTTRQSPTHNRPNLAPYHRPTHHLLPCRIPLAVMARPRVRQAIGEAFLTEPGSRDVWSVVLRHRLCVAVARGVRALTGDYTSVAAPTPLKSRRRNNVFFVQRRRSAMCSFVESQSIEQYRVPASRYQARLDIARAQLLIRSQQHASRQLPFMILVARGCWSGHCQGRSNIRPRGLMTRPWLSWTFVSVTRGSEERTPRKASYTAWRLRGGCC